MKVNGLSCHVRNSKIRPSRTVTGMKKNGLNNLMKTPSIFTDSTLAIKRVEGGVGEEGVLFFYLHRLHLKFKYLNFTLSGVGHSGAVVTPWFLDQGVRGSNPA